jgi:hypothetical protein
MQTRELSGMRVSNLFPCVACPAGAVQNGIPRSRLPSPCCPAMWELHDPVRLAADAGAADALVLASLSPLVTAKLFLGPAT